MGSLRIYAASVGLALVTLAGCTGTPAADQGDPGDPGTRAPSAAQFCGALSDYQADLAGADPSDPTTYGGRLKAAATRLAAAGTPTDLPSAARAGLGATLTQIADLPDAPTPDDLDGLGPRGREARQQVAALDDYVAAACP